MTKAQLHSLANDKQFVSECAQIAKQFGITPEEWNANKGLIIGLWTAAASQL